MAERTTEQAPRGGWRPGFYMRPKHLGLVLCVSLVGCMVAFGAGFIVGMGYKASEQVSPYAVKKPTTAESQQGEVSGAELGGVLFIDGLVTNETVGMAPEAETTPAPTVVAEEMAPQATGQTTSSAEAIQAPEPVPAAPTPSPTPPVVAERTGPDAPARSPAIPSRGTDSSVVATYSVQVASVLTPERAERLVRELTEEGYHAYIHPFIAPGQPLWYRVKVGKFPDRATASRTLEKLGTPDAMITRD